MENGDHGSGNDTDQYHGRGTIGISHIKNLPSRYIIYYEPEIRNTHPDFVILGPDLGIVVLEVKDYTKSPLLMVNHDKWHIFSAIGERPLS